MRAVLASEVISAFAADRPATSRRSGAAALAVPPFISKIECESVLDLALDALDEIGQPVDDGLQQPNEHCCAAGEAEVRLGGSARRRSEKHGARHTQRDQPVAGENEGDRRRHRLLPSV